MKIEEYKPWAYVERVAWLFPAQCDVCFKWIKKGDEYIQLFCEGPKVITLCYVCQHILGDFKSKLKRLNLIPEV